MDNAVFDSNGLQSSFSLKWLTSNLLVFVHLNGLLPNWLVLKISAGLVLFFRTLPKRSSCESSMNTASTGVATIPVEYLTDSK